MNRGTCLDMCKKNHKTMRAWTRACVQFECVVCMLVYDGVSLLQKRMSFFFLFLFVFFSDFVTSIARA